MKTSSKWGILLATTAAGVLAVLWMPPIPQWASYNHFADGRTLRGIPNFWDVISNLPFFLVALGGFITLGRQWREKSFRDWKEITPYSVFFLGVMLTGWGSSYYHLSPDNSRLVWDRIPMTIVFMSLVAIILSERVGARLGFWALTGLSSFIRQFLLR